jgi:hypothetical protein
MEPQEWKILIEEEIQKRPPPIKAETYRDVAFKTGSKPVMFRCDDGNNYVVKTRCVDDARLAKEQIIAGLGHIIGAPVPQVRPVDVSPELIEQVVDRIVAQYGDQFKALKAGVGHGCFYVGKCQGPVGVLNQDAPQNRQRHARLAVLYGWVKPGDKQLFYELSEPPLLWTFDHGEFSLSEGGGKPFEEIVKDAQVSKEELLAVKEILENVSAQNIASAVARPHETWGVTIDQMVAYARHFDAKRIELIANIA